MLLRRTASSFSLLTKRGTPHSWLALLAAVVACSGPGPASEGEAPDAGSAGHGAREPQPVAPVPPLVAPELPDVSDRDQDHDRIDDAFSVGGDAAGSVSVEVILEAPTTQRQLDAFVRLGGQVRHVFAAVSYGWTGSIARGQLSALRDELGAPLRLLAAPKATTLFLDEATRTGRVRVVWASNFAGLSSGVSGNSNITIAILDTGVDGSHTDLSGRMVAWKDYSSDNNASSEDVVAHGTHVASIALGTGAAFGLGPGTLRFTNSGTMSSTVAGAFSPGPIHTPSYLGGSSTLTATSSAIFLGGVSATLALVTSNDAGGAWGAFANTSGASPRSIGSTSTSNGAARFTDALVQSTPAGVTNFAVSNTVSNYPAVGDGFNALRGVAPGCKWYGGKVFSDAGTGTTAETGVALDDMVTLRVADNIKVVNMSLGAVGTDSTLRAKANTVVNNGIVVVVAAGNGGPSGTIGDPGLANKVITVGAANDKNELTSYTSIGTAAADSTTDDKPDLLAPGGSSYRSLIMAADSNTQDAGSTSFADAVANDYTGKQGTSMASPFVAGAAALVIDALQQSGVTWTLSSSTQPLFVKMLLLASATESNVNREQSAGSNPTLGRSTTPKDLYEGFGLLNPDAAIEGITTAMPASFSGSASNTLPARLEWERRAWGRKVPLINGANVGLTLSVPSTADYDLYLYSGTPNANGAPVIRAASANAGLDTDESLSFTSSTTETAYVFVKRVSGYGSFTLTSTLTDKCGNGTVDTGEECDPGSAGVTTCCSATCQAVTAGTACNDGNACTQTDTCQAGVCTGSNSKTCSASDQCHDAGTCNTSTGVCSNPTKSNGSTCSDGNACTQTGTCQAGTCTGGSAKTCAASDQCHDAGTCDASTGTCSNPAKSNGTTCSDGNACTQTDTCQSGVCTGSNSKTCSASDQCHDAGACNTSTGVCSNPAKSNGASCSDGNACTQTDTCQAGTCTGGSAKTCAASDQCHDVGTCDTSTGACSNPAKSNGASCNDGNACTQTDTCQAGTCTGGSGKTCAASDQCHDAGTCDATTGACSNPAKANGSSCSDGNACTQTDTCQAGTCTGSSPKTCSAADQCHSAGTCDPTTGACTNPAKADGSSCSDGNACTQSDTCQAGACTGSNAISCAASDQCHVAGSCDPTTGACTNPAKANGASCNDGNACTQADTCQAGTCVGSSPVSCSASDQCHLAGSCDPSTGACTNPAKSNGTQCNDANACTQSDSCQAGACLGGSAIVCSASDQCHGVGVCDPQSGMCSNPVLDGAQCNDGNACTQTDHCQAGICTGANPVSCPASGECELTATCAPATGQCSSALAPDGTPCTNGTCGSGLCVPAGGFGGSGAGGAAGAAAGGTGGAAGSGGAGAANGGTASGGTAGGGTSTGGASAGSGGSAATDGGATSGDAGEANGGSAGPSGGASGATQADGGAASTAKPDAGLTGEAGAAPETTNPAGANAKQDSGCGCSEVGARPNAHAALWLLGALVLSGARRRRNKS